METICRHGEGPNCPDCYVYELEDLRKLLSHPNTPHILGKMLRDGLVRRMDITLRKLKEAEINEVNLTEPHRAFRPSVEENPEPVPDRPPFKAKSSSHQPAATPPLPSYQPPPSNPPLPSTPPLPTTQYVVLSPHPVGFMSPMHEMDHHMGPSPFHYTRHSLTAPRYSTTRSPQYSPYSSQLPRYSMPLPHDSEEDEIFFSARSAAVPKNKFQPSVVRGSAFGSSHSVHIPSYPRPESYDGDVDPPSNPIRKTQHPLRNSKWTIAEVQMLLQGFTRFGPKWETIRANFPGLAHYSGVQLKDKHRHLSGR